MCTGGKGGPKGWVLFAWCLLTSSSSAFMIFLFNLSHLKYILSLVSSFCFHHRSLLMFPTEYTRTLCKFYSLFSRKHSKLHFYSDSPGWWLDFTCVLEIILLAFKIFIILFSFYSAYNNSACLLGVYHHQWWLLCAESCPSHFGGCSCLYLKSSVGSSCI